MAAVRLVDEVGLFVANNEPHTPHYWESRQYTLCSEDLVLFAGRAHGVCMGRETQCLERQLEPEAIVGIGQAQPRERADAGQAAEHRLAVDAEQCGSLGQVPVRLP